MVALLAESALAECYDKQQFNALKPKPPLVTKILKSYWKSENPNLVMKQFKTWNEGFEFNPSSFSVLNQYAKGTSYMQRTSKIREICWEGSNPKEITVKIAVSIGTAKIALTDAGNNKILIKTPVGNIKAVASSRSQHAAEIKKSANKPPDGVL